MAVTRPFLFEGPKKRQAADALTAQLQECAHLVAVIDQVRNAHQSRYLWLDEKLLVSLEGPGMRDDVCRLYPRLSDQSCTFANTTSR